jgi:N-acetyl-alpha-D-glucosaminyl L-malate synthase BshA
LDIIHVHYALPHASVAYMAQQILKDQWIHLPFVTTLHGTDITLVGQDSSYEPVISFAIEHSNAVTSVSEYLKQATYENFTVTKDIHVIPNFINFEYCDRFEHDNELKQTFCPKGEKLLIHVSNLRSVKRVEDVILTFKWVQEKTPAKLLIVGDGPERSILEKLSRDLQISEHIHFLWKIKKVEKILKAADLFLLPSAQESFWLSALEAMAAWVPVVSSNAWWLAEVNIHGISWYLADIWDVQAMTEFALEILSDDAVLEKFRTQAHNQAKNFCIHKILPLYEHIYTSLM